MKLFRSVSIGAVEFIGAIGLSSIYATGLIDLVACSALPTYFHAFGRVWFLSFFFSFFPFFPFFFASEAVRGCRFLSHSDGGSIFAFALGSQLGEHVIFLFCLVFIGGEGLVQV